MQDNPSLPRLYLTGAYYFIMMYTGSNILPIARCVPAASLTPGSSRTRTCSRPTFPIRSSLISFGLQVHACTSNLGTHPQETGRSILGPLLPQALVCYLENYGANALYR